MEKTVKRMGEYNDNEDVFHLLAKRIGKSNTKCHNDLQKLHDMKDAIPNLNFEELLILVHDVAWKLEGWTLDYNQYKEELKRRELALFFNEEYIEQYKSIKTRENRIRLEQSPCKTELNELDWQLKQLQMYKKIIQYRIEYWLGHPCDGECGGACNE